MQGIALLSEDSTLHPGCNILAILRVSPWPLRATCIGSRIPLTQQKEILPMSQGTLYPVRLSEDFRSTPVSPIPGMSTSLRVRTSGVLRAILASHRRGVDIQRRYRLCLGERPSVQGEIGTDVGRAARSSRLRNPGLMQPLGQTLDLRYKRHSSLSNWRLTWRNKHAPRHTLAHHLLLAQRALSAMCRLVSLTECWQSI